MLRLWTNFAKTGNPNLPETGDVLWEPLTTKESSFLDIGAMEMSLPANYQRRTNFWHSVFTRPPSVDTAQGSVIGSYLSSVSGRTFRAFQGVPYAAPPVDDLRFAAPSPPVPRTTIYEATHLRPACPQLEGPYPIPEGQSEDCLHLNIYTPEEAPSPLPVMVYIHGGALVRGSGGTYFHGPEILLDREIVLVTVNYRLGPLGMLSLESDYMEGNQGLRDQAAALVWVRDNILAFGGDPGRVTLAGESAGGFSTVTHLVSPASGNLFQAAIAMSGSPVRLTGADSVLAPGLARRITQDLAASLDCPAMCGDTAVLGCLRAMPLHNILEASSIFTNSSSGAVQVRKPFSWVVDAAFSEDSVLPVAPEEALAAGDFHKVPLLTGVTRDEGLYQAAKYILNPDLLTSLNDNWDILGPKIIFDKKTNVTEEEHDIVARIRQFYFGDSSIDSSQLQSLVNMFSDLTFWSAAHRTVELVTTHPGHPPVYLYIFSHPGAWGYGQVFPLFHFFILFQEGPFSFSSYPGPRSAPWLGCVPR